jgi:hypothetical protein
MTLLRNLGWGASWGLAFATGIALLVGATALIGGSTVLGKYGLTAGSMLGMYFLAGLAGGLVVGLMRPLTASWLGAAVVGLCASIPAAGIIGAFLYGYPADWQRHEIIGTALAAAAGGPLGGIIVRYNTKSAP